MYRTRNVGGYLKGDRVEAGDWSLRIRLSPECSLPRREANIRAYWADDEGFTEFIPCVALLPHGRYLPGWTMGESMCTGFDVDIYDDEREAWLAAHHAAERGAEAERDYRASLCPECFAESDGSLCESCAKDALPFD